jgi:hypothetical protein
MEPRVICLTASSVDDWTLHSRWRPQGSSADRFERVHDELASSSAASLARSIAKGKPHPDSTKKTLPREHWFARHEANAYGVVLDARGRIGWCRSDIGRDPIVILSDAVSDARTWRGYAARACPTSSPEARSSIRITRSTGVSWIRQRVECPNWARADLCGLRLQAR